jgi:Type IV secretion system pilin
MRILTTLIILISSISIGLIAHEIYALCDITSQENASDYLKWCAGTNPANSISPGIGTDTSQIKKIIIDISKNVIAFGSLFAIGAIVFSGIQYTTSYGDDEKVKKAKTTGIYAISGLLLLLLAFPLVDIIINFVYSLA